MTVNTTNITSGPYAGNGVTTQFSYTFRIETKSQMLVYETDTDGVQTLLTVDTDYTVSDLGEDSGGIVTRVAGALPTGYSWYIRSNYQQTQLTDLDSQGGFFPDVHEAALDKLTFLIQQINDQLGRSVRIDESDDTGSLEPLPSLVAERFLQVNATANGFDLFTIGNSPVTAEVPIASYDDFRDGVGFTIGDYSDGQVIHFTNDRVAGAFILKTGATPADNKGTVIRSNVDSNRYVERVEGWLTGGPINVEWFGAVADGVTDSTTAFSDTMSVAQSSARSVYAPGDRQQRAYLVDQIIVPRNVTFFGDGCMGTQDFNYRSATVIQQNDGNENDLINFDPISGTEIADITIRDMILLGPDTATTGEYNGIGIRTSAGVGLSMAGQSFFERVLARRFKGSGVASYGRIYNLGIKHCNLRDNGRFGFETFGGDIKSSYIFKCNMEGNRLAAVNLAKLNTGQSFSIDGLYVEHGATGNVHGDAGSFFPTGTFAYASPYSVVLNGMSTGGDSVVHIKNMVCLANQSTSQAAEAAIYEDTDASSDATPVQWENVWVENIGITSGAKNMWTDGTDDVSFRHQNGVMGSTYTSYNQIADGSARALVGRVPPARGTTDNSMTISGTTPSLLLYETDTDDTTRIRMSATSFDIQNINSAGTTTNLVQASTGLISILGGAGDFRAGRFEVVEVRAKVDNTYTLGTASNRFTDVYAVSGSVNTSDEREKTPIQGIEDKEKAAARAIQKHIGKFKWLSEVDEKGDSAKWCFGVGAQTVIRILEEHGLDWEDYEFIKYDEWGDEFDGETRITETGDRFGVRYEQLAMFVLASI